MVNAPPRDARAAVVPQHQRAGFGNLDRGRKGAAAVAGRRGVDGVAGAERDGDLFFDAMTSRKALNSRPLGFKLLPEPLLEPIGLCGGLAFRQLQNHL